MSAYHLFVVNPAAGGIGGDPSRLKTAIEAVMAERGCEYEIYETTGHMDAAEKVKREALKGYPLRIYACGGDGTLSECAHGAAGFRNAAVTNYPCGTGNDFVKTFPEDTELFSNIELLVDGDVTPIDLIDVNGRRCINICSVGIDARVGVDVHRFSKLPLVKGKAAYNMSLVVNVLKGLTQNMTISDGAGFERSGSTTLVCVCNGRCYGGGFRPVGTSEPDDGILDMLVVKGINLLTVAKCLGTYSKGEYYKLPQYITYIPGKSLTVSADKALTVQIDGEAMVTKNVTMRVLPGALNFILPKGSAFMAAKKAKIEVN